MICVFDCETIPDVGLIRKSFAIDVLLGDYEVTQSALTIYEEQNKTPFLPIPYHRVVAIAAVIADDYGKFLKVGQFGGDEMADERSIISHFLAFLDEKNPRLISFNGRGFDLPMLMVRALKYNLSCPAYFEQDNQMVNKTKWENYRQRYSEQFHIDLLDSLSHYGAVRGLKLDTLCAMAGLPGKFDVSGDQVTSLYYAGEYQKIREYCESDVLNTYWLYLKYELLKGNLTKQDYLALLEILAQKLPKQRSYSQVFLDALKGAIGV